MALLYFYRGSYFAAGIYMKSTLAKLVTVTLLGLALAACCPKEGVDHSFTVADYAVAVDYYSQGAPIEAKLATNNETLVELFNSSAQFEKHIYFNYDQNQKNRIIYYFSESWSTDQINSINIKYRDYALNNINFNTIEKASFQRQPKPYSQLFAGSVSYLDQIECVIKSVAEVFIPRAQAMSCKASESSTISYRAGTLIRIDLD